MISVLVAVLIISCIGSGLAAVLVLADRIVNNYGECTVTINEGKALTTQGGRPLLSVLSQEKIFLPSACGGRGTCGYCKVKVLQGGGPLLPTEEPFLEKDERQQGIRLSCLLKVREDMRIEIPPELLQVKEYVAVCEQIIDLTHDIKQFRFRLQDPPTIDYVPGQYVQLLSPVYEKSKEEVYRAYSMSSDPAEKDVIETIMRLVPGGICTTYCFEYLKIGDTVKFNGPYGDFHLSDTDAPILFIAGGSGMAPIKCMLHQMKNENIERKAVYYFGANYVKEMFLVDLMRRFERELYDFRFVPVVARPETDWAGQVGLVTEAVERDLTDIADFEAYLCGSPGMIDAAIAALKKLGMTEDRIYYDKFA